MTDETHITNLLHLYAERMDAGDLPAVAALFRHARILLGGGQEVDHSGLLAAWQDMVILYPCGTPRTRHVITNPIITVDEGGTTASCRSCYTVMQQTEDFPLQVIAVGRYHDRFEKVDGEWRFAFRDYSLFDMPGNLSHHLRGWS